MDKKEMYCVFVKGDKGRWMLPVEVTQSEYVKYAQNDGVAIIPLEGKFVHTDTMKSYNVQVKGTNKNWFFTSPLEPEVAEEMRNAGVPVLQQIDEPEKEIGEEATVVASKKSKSKGKVEE